MHKSLSADVAARRLALSMIIVMAVVLASFCVSELSDAKVGDKFYDGGARYEILSEPSGTESGTVSVIGYDSEASDINLDGSTEYCDISYLVTSVGKYAFANCTTLVFASMPYVTVLEDGAFYNCTSLEKATFGSDLTSVTGNPFMGCTSLSEFSGKNNVSEIYLVADSKVVSYAIANEATSLSLPGSITVVGNSAFYNADKVEEVDLGSITSLESYAFDNCDALTSVTLPSSLEEIGDNPFGTCISLTEFRGNYGGIMDDGKMLVTGKKLVSYAMGTQQSSIVIPNDIEEIGKFAFSDCGFLQHLDLGDVKTIGSLAFTSCNGLVTVKFPDNLETMDSYSFSVFFDRDVSVENMRGNYFMDEGAGKLCLAYEITWNNSDGSLIETTLVRENAVPEHDAPEVPSGFAFAGWDPSPVAAVEDATYTAIVSDPTAKYSVQILKTGSDGNVSKSTFKLLFGSEIKADGTSLKVGSYKMSMGVPETDERYTYSFTGWMIDGEPIPESGTTVKGDTVITGTIEAETRSYEVAIATEGNGSVSESSVTVLYGSAVYSEGDVMHVGDVDVVATPGESDADYMYKLSEWKQDAYQVKGTMTVTAVFEAVPLIFYYDQVKYRIVSESEVDVVGYEDGVVAVIIPGSVSNDGVDYVPVSIAEGAFSGCETITSVEIGPTIASIASDSLNCPFLASITVDGENSAYSSLKGTLYDKDKGVLVKFPSAKQRIVIPDSVWKIGEYAFYEAGKAVKEAGGTPFTYAYLPSNVWYIQPYAFYGSTVETLKIHGIYNQISDYAFGDCKSLCYVLFPTSFGTWSVSDTAFDGCVFHDENGEEMEFDVYTMSGHKLVGDGYKDLKIYVPPVGSRIHDCGITFKITSNADSKEVVAVGLDRDNTDTSIYIYSQVVYLGFKWTVASVAPKAFAENNEITEVLCSADVGYRSFWKCGSLQTVKLDCYEVGSYAFASCPNLEKIDTSASYGNGQPLTSIGASAFSSCPSLSSIDLSTVKTIGDKAFFHCALKNVDLSSAESIGGWAFNGNALERVKFGGSLAEVDAHAFGGYVFQDSQGARLSVSAENLRGMEFSGSDKVLKDVFGQSFKVSVSAFPAGFATLNGSTGTLELGVFPYGTSITIRHNILTVGDEEVVAESEWLTFAYYEVCAGNDQSVCEDTLIVAHFTG